MPTQAACNGKLEASCRKKPAILVPLVACLIRQKVDQHTSYIFEPFSMALYSKSGCMMSSRRGFKPRLVSKTGLAPRNHQSAGFFQPKAGTGSNESPFTSAGLVDMKVGGCV